jgi:hypothetical protein
MEVEKKKEIEKRLSRLKQHNHVCLLYETPEERFSVIAAFFKFALARSDKCIYVNSVTDDEDVIDNIDWFSRGVDIEKHSKKNDLEVVGRNKMCKGPRLASGTLCTAVEKEYVKATSEGYDGLTLTLEMTNIAAPDVSLSSFRAHESRMNNILERNDITGICQYNINKFPTAYIKYMIFTHPLVIYKDCKRIYEL